MNKEKHSRDRANSFTSIKEHFKRRREELDTSKEEEVFQRSKITPKSPIRIVEAKEKNQQNMEDLKEMMTGLAKLVNDGFRDSKRESNEIKEKLETIEKSWNDKVREMEQVIEDITVKAGKQDERVAALEDQLEKYEKERKRENIIIKNLAIDGQVTPGKIEKFLNSKMQTRIEVVDAFKVGRIAEKQVIVAKLKDFGQKKMIMENKNKLKGTNTYIENDLTNREKVIQNQIWAVAKNEMKNGDKVKVGYQKMFKNNKIYIWDKKDNALRLSTDQDPHPKN